MPAFISDRFRFIYVRQPKSSSSAAVKNMLLMLGLPPSSKRHPPDLIRTAAVHEIPDAVWSSYFVFTIVRNPYTRLASAYTFLSRYLALRDSKHPAAPPRTPANQARSCSVNFAAFARDSWALVAQCAAAGCCLYLDPVGAWSSDFARLHLNDQAGAVFAPDGRPLVDFIGRKERFSEDWVAIVAAINARQNSTLRAVDKGRQNEQHIGAMLHNPGLRAAWAVNATAGAAGAAPGACKDEYAAMYDEERMRGVATQYAVDMLRFGFLQARQAQPARNDGGAQDQPA